MKNRMSRRKEKKFRSRAVKHEPKGVRADSVSQIELEGVARRSAGCLTAEKYFEFFLIVVFLAFGIYQSVLYFGHKLVPNSDFPAIIGVGHKLLSFQIPEDFKQTPVVGLLQALLSHLVGGQYPELTAGWLLNAILHPLNLILFWLVGRKIIGKSALWFAVIAILNYWVIYMLIEPLKETSLLFFSLLTFYLIFKRSNWSYLLASITTMVRYEGAALIMAAFVMDMIYCKSRRERIRSFLYSALATIPLALWMLGTVLSWEEGTTHYLSVLFKGGFSEGFAEPAAERTGVVKHMQLLWLVGFRPLFMPYIGASNDFVQMLWKLSKIVAVVGFFFGSVYGLCKRQWNILALLIFFVPYFLLHARYPYPIQRFHSTIFWIALLLCWFGLQSGWKLIDGKGRIPKGLLLALQVLVAIVSIIWLVSIISYLPEASRFSPKSASLPYVAMSLVGLIFAGRIFVYSPRHILRELSILTFVCLIIVSNQFALAGLVGDGQADKEFKLLADWYIANAKPGEKMLSTLPHVVRLYAPKHKDSLLQVGDIEADNPSDFIKKCYEEDITYVAWDSRLGLNPGNEYYKFWGLKNIAILAQPKNIGPYEFITQIRANKRRFIYIFRLHKPSELVGQEPSSK